MTDETKKIPVTVYQVALLIKKIAWKIGEDYGLAPADFEFILDTSLEDNSFRIAAGPKVIVRHKIIPSDTIDFQLRRIIEQIPPLVRSKALQLSSDVVASNVQFKALSPEPELEDSEFVEIELLQVVRVVHKSGFCVTKASAAGVGNFTKLVSLAKKETADLLRALEDSDNA